MKRAEKKPSVYANALAIAGVSSMMVFLWPFIFKEVKHHFGHMLFEEIA